MREALVRQAMPQNSWPTEEISSTVLREPVPSASVSSGIEPPLPDFGLCAAT